MPRIGIIHHTLERAMTGKPGAPPLSIEGGIYAMVVAGDPPDRGVVVFRPETGGFLADEGREGDVPIGRVVTMRDLLPPEGMTHVFVDVASTPKPPSPAADRSPESR